jgi:hypothetical protein
MDRRIGLVAGVSLWLGACAGMGPSQSVSPWGVQQSAGPYGPSQSVGPGGVEQDTGGFGPSQSVGPTGVRQCAGPYGPCQTVGPTGVYQGAAPPPAAPRKTAATSSGQGCQLHCSGGDVSVQCPVGKNPVCRCEPQPQAQCEAPTRSQ